MKIKQIKVENFGSYPQFEHDFTDPGLSLVYGATGSGKSTFMDMVAWILYGVTAKDGNVDEVRSWQSPNDPTTGTAEVEVNGHQICVFRSRGKAGNNDLFWIQDGGEEQRGKDLQDTQRLLDSALDCTAHAYLYGSYLHEFSPTGTFWTASAKDRRKLFERVAPLDFPATLAQKASDARKEVKTTLGKIEVSLAGLEGQLSSMSQVLADATTRSAGWAVDQKAKAEALALKAVRFETDRAMEVAKLTSVANQWQTNLQTKIDTLTDELLEYEKKIKDPTTFDTEIRRFMEQSRCSSCKALPLTANAGIARLQQEKTVNAYNVKYFEDGKTQLRLLAAEQRTNPYTLQVEAAKQRGNTYQQEGARVLAETNPFAAQQEQLGRESRTLATKVASGKGDKTLLEGRVASLTRIYELSFELRGQMLQRAVQAIQDGTNGLLERYFDAEIRVTFSLPSSDTLEVEIQKSGYDCTYRQLSKGQRGLLKLCFGVSVMEAVANQAGIANNVMFLDEALDGLDESLKVKAHGLFLELATRHNSVYLIDHSPGLQNLMDRRYRVELIGDASLMTLES